MDEQLERIKNKLEQLKNLDTNYSVFGASTHKYRLNPPVSVAKIKKFESFYRTRLPDEYVAFLMIIGNGGAGPFYGLEPLEDVMFDDLDNKKPGSLLNPSKPFLHTEAWNQTFEPTVDAEENEEEYQKQRIQFEEKYFDKQQMNGVIAICNFGCAVRINLVVNGKEYGNIWTDDRSSDYGIHPSYELGNKEKINFLNWYELWLDNSLTKKV
ncbi:SMI1/KNR4 family protein [Chitinophaga arvensicola]|uniref:SMI1 / KNR4 family (SUKH-1) n=1 Tax=Chitinophaga arvensicola TaxID=29529 RepID=A0A1I0SE54_9BACT|nr:SMI1/KNR4 family protein [Chitinophaga arvensicola]SEW57475.1 SMI1 / KNR4 family (SUKH-1) [Chitinophaga arvensicola]